MQPFPTHPCSAHSKEAACWPTPKQHIIVVCEGPGKGAPSWQMVLFHNKYHPIISAYLGEGAEHVQDFMWRFGAPSPRKFQLAHHYTSSSTDCTTPTLAFVKRQQVTLPHMITLQPVHGIDTEAEVHHPTSNCKKSEQSHT